MFDGALSSQDNGVLVHNFFPFPTSYTGGVYLATGDVKGTGGPTSSPAPAAANITPTVKVWNGVNPAFVLWGFDVPLQGGLPVAAGDTNGDGKAEVILGNCDPYLAQVLVYDGNTRVQSGPAITPSAVSPEASTSERATSTATARPTSSLAPAPAADRMCASIAAPTARC